MKLPSRIKFADAKVRQAFEELRDSKTEDQALYKFLSQAFENLKEDAFAGIQIPKKLIPKKYLQKYGIDNLWKYNLPNAWRLLYSVGQEEVVVISIILDWMPHKDYERKFGYKKS